MKSSRHRRSSIVVPMAGEEEELISAAGAPRGRLRIAPTRYGVIFLAILAALLLGSINHNNNLGYLLTFLLGGTAGVSLFHSMTNISGISPSAIRAKPVFAGQEARFELTFPPLTASRPALSFHLDTGEPTTVNLGSGSKQSITVSMSTSRRGLLAPAVLFIDTIYPLGLFRARAILPIHAACLVYPRPVHGPLQSVPGPLDTDGQGDAAANGVDDFAGLNPYQPGDPLQRISWKTFSRGQGLFTKSFEGLRGKGVYFNPDILPGHDHELKLARVCHMILMAEAMQTPYGLILGNRTITPDSGERHKRQCLKELALAEYLGHDQP